MYGAGSALAIKGFHATKSFVAGVLGLLLLLLTVHSYSLVSNAAVEIHSGTVTAVYNVACGKSTTPRCAKEFVTFHVDGRPRNVELGGYARNGGRIGRPVTVEWERGSFQAWEQGERTPANRNVLLFLSGATVVYLVTSVVCGVQSVRKTLSEN